MSNVIHHAAVRAVSEQPERWEVGNIRIEGRPTDATETTRWFDLWDFDENDEEPVASFNEDDIGRIHSILTAILTPPAPSPVEPGAEAAKFKVGEKVRVTKDGADYAEVDAGTEFVVTKILRPWPDSIPGCRYYGLISGEYVREQNLELAEAATPATTRPTKCCYPGCPNLADPRWYYRGGDGVSAPACDGHGYAPPAPAANEATTTREEFNEAKEREAARAAYARGDDGSSVQYAACLDSFINGWLAHARRTS